MLAPWFLVALLFGSPSSPATTDPTSAPKSASVAQQATTTARPRPTVTYVPPVDAPVVDHFRPPSCRWCPGNRGIDYLVAPGTSVGASAAGVVTFAGRVGNDLFVVIAHADGLRTTYAYLARVAVTAGQRVGQGQLVGTTGTTLHFGVRLGDVYLDPELLFGGGRLVARLVPLDGGGVASGDAARVR